MVEPIATLLERKAELRARGLAARQQQPHRKELSRAIAVRLGELPEYQAARVVMYYVGVSSEVHTLALLTAALQQGKTVVVPYMASSRIELFRLEEVDELAPGHFNILEPRRELRTQPDRTAAAEQIELVVVPGVAFDRQGGRLGHGRGYYDELLKRLRPEVPRIALAYECQLFDQIPMLPHDMPMHKVITERAVYEGPRHEPR
jgi:5-formyltetrahydrofolate cyclo-ligase